MSLNEEFEKDEIQLKKAKIKVVAVTSLIPELVRLNNELSMEDRKPYTILLDYIPFDDYNNFIIDIRRTDKSNISPLLRIHFGLKNVEDGLELFNEVRDCYLENNPVLYTSFKTLPFSEVAEHYHICGQNRIDLKYQIHTEEEYMVLKEHNDKLYTEKPKFKVLV